MDHSVFTLIDVTGIGILLALESRAAAFRTGFSDPRRLRRNLAFLIVNVGAALLLKRTGAYLAPLIASFHASLAVPGNASSWRTAVLSSLWVQIPLAFLLAELLNWMLHWAKHANSYLWRFHCQHHKEDQFSVWLVVHTYAPEMFLAGTVIVAVVLLSGVSKAALDVYLLFYSLANVYQHSARPYSLGWLDKLIINPAYHRQHHSGAQVNFASTLTVWDCVFGRVSWPKHHRDLVNLPSIDQTPEPFGFVDEMLYPLKPSRWVEGRSFAADAIDLRK